MRTTSACALPLLLFLQTITFGQQIITTAAGTTWTFTGEGKPATAASLGPITSVATDAAGNIYAADAGHHMIVRITPAGILSVVAGTGVAGRSGDGGPAVAAMLNYPSSIKVDSAGNLYFIDGGNQAIRRISTSGIIATVPGASSLSSNLDKLAVDSAGNLYIAGDASHQVRKLTPAGVLTVVAGVGVEGFSGDGGPAVNARLAHPAGLALDAAGNLYISDRNSSRVRRVTPAGVITTIAGNGGNNFADGVPALNASLSRPEDLEFDRAGNLYIADSGINYVWRIDPSGIIRRVAGNNGRDFTGDNGPAINASLGGLSGLAVAPSGNWYVSDIVYSRVRRIDASGTIATIAGNGNFKFAGDGGPAVAASLNLPFHTASDAAGNLYIADWGNHRVRKVGVDGIISTVAGTGEPVTGGDGGPAAGAPVLNPSSVVVDAGGNVFIADGGRRVRRVSPAGIITTVLPEAGFAVRELNQLAVDAAGSVYVAEPGSNRVRKIATTGVITTVAGNGSDGFSGDGGAAVRASLSLPTGVAVDSAANVYISDSRNHRIRKVDPAGNISTIAGNGAAGFAGDGGPARDARISFPRGLAVDAAGNLYVCDAGNNRVRRVSPDGVMTTVAGTGVFGLDGDGGAAERAALNGITGLSIDARGNLYITDTGNDRIRVVLAAGASSQMVEDQPHLSFSFSRAGSRRTQTLLVTNRSAGLLGFTAVGHAITGNWLSVSPGSGSIGPAASAGIVVAADPTGLAPSTYRGTVTIANATGSRSVPVTMTISPLDDSISLSRTSLSFTAVVPGGPLAAQTVTVQAATPARWSLSKSTLSGGSAWLTATAVPPSITVGVDATGLPAGRYYGQVRVDASGAANAPQVVTVSLEVRSSGGGPPAADAPVFDRSGIVSVAGGSAYLPFAPGAAISIYGDRLAGSAIQAPAAALPLELGGTQVLLAGVRLPLYYVSRNQVNAVIPYQAIANGTAQLVVQRDLTYSAPVTVNIAAAQPVIFNAIYAYPPDGSPPFLVTPDSPAAAGDTIVLYCTGLGAVSPGIVDGEPAGSPPPVITGEATLRIGASTARLTYAGLAPGFAGLYQVNAVIPAGVVAGAAVPIDLTVEGQTSPVATLAIK